MENLRMQKGDSFVYRLNDSTGKPLLNKYHNPKTECFFFIGETETLRDGQVYHVACRWVDSPAELNDNCFMSLTEEQFRGLIESGVVEMI